MFNTIFKIMYNMGLYTLNDDYLEDRVPSMST